MPVDGTHHPPARRAGRLTSSRAVDAGPGQPDAPLRARLRSRGRTTRPRAGSLASATTHPEAHEQEAAPARAEACNTVLRAAGSLGRVAWQPGERVVHSLSPQSRSHSASTRGGPEESQARRALPWAVEVVSVLPHACGETISGVATAAVLVLTGSAVGASPQMPPQCSAPATQRGGIMFSAESRAYGPYLRRYCGRGRAVVRVGSKTFVFNGGRCTSRRLGFGLVGNVANAKGMWLVLEQPNRTGRNNVIDGAIHLPGDTGEIAVSGSAIHAKGLNTATFSLYGRGKPGRFTGTWTCGTFI